MAAPVKTAAIPILRAGPITTAIGHHPSNLTEGDLIALASSYRADAAVMFASPAPFEDQPKVIFIRALSVENGTLFAITHSPDHASFAAAPRGRPLTFASFYAPGSRDNPTPGELHLHSIGFFDHMPVPGKGSIPGGGVALYQGDIAAFASPASKNRPSSREAALERLLLDQKVEKLIGEGRLLPLMKDEVISFCAGIDRNQTVSFASGETTSAKDWMISFLERMPKVVSFGAMDLGPDPLTDAPHGGLNMPPGREVDRNQAELASRAQHVMAQNPGMTFADAVVLAHGRA